MTHHEKTSLMGRFAHRVGRALGFSRSRGTTGDDPMALPPMTRGTGVLAALLFFVAGASLTALVLIDPLGLGLFKGSADMAAGDARGESETVYTCPMHPQVVQDQPGDCPLCGMDLVAAGNAARDDREGETVYTCPMHPQVVQDQPGDCPLCGMDLVAKDRAVDGDRGTKRGSIEIDPRLIQRSGVVSVAASRRDLRRTVETVGVLDYDAQKLATITPKYEGWIESTFVSYVGETVRVGDPLFEIYAPDLVATQEEYLRALEYRRTLAESGSDVALEQAERLVEATRERLRLWGIDDEQIEALETSGRARRTLPLRAGVGGVVTEIMADSLEGMFVRPGMALYRLADLSTLWVDAEVYESDLGWIQQGQPVEVRFDHDPGLVVRGHVRFVDTLLDPKTRTLGVGIEIANPGGRLRPGMFARVAIQGPTIPGAILVPRSAVLRTGRRDLVFVDLGEGRFEPRDVVIGASAGRDEVRIVEGLEAGERVVSRATFLLDSESRIQEAIAGFRGTDDASPDGHAH